MKQMAILIAVLGGALTAFGLSGWQADMQPRFMLPGQSGPDWTFTAGWRLNSQVEVTAGTALLVCGLMLHRHSR